MTTKAWVRLPLDLLRDPTTSLAATVVYALIADKAEGAAEVIQLSASDLAQSAGISKRTAFRALEELESKNLIIREAEAGAATHIRLRSELLPPKKRRRKEEAPEHSYDLEEMKKLANRF